MNRVAAVVGACWGVTLLAHTARLTSGPQDGQPTSMIEVRAVRLLGVRHLAEAAALARYGARVRRPVVLTEVTHAASMVALAIGSPRYRRAASTSAAMATLLAVLTAAASSPADSLG